MKNDVKMVNLMKNFNKVQIKNLDLYFSFETIVAFQRQGQPLIASHNIWTRTTGKHLNLISYDKKERFDHKEFERLLDLEISMLGENTND